jgi:hypothetical protein
MRHFIKLNNKGFILDWLLADGAVPSTLPVFPEDSENGLVVAHLMSGDVVAEVIPKPTHVKKACGGGVPLGRLYFHIPKTRLYKVCSNLSPESFTGGA